MILLSMAVVMSMTMLFAQSREGLTEYKLDNGLTVMLWEDHDQPDVTGYVAVRAGSMDEPAEYTGLAHYLEHMLFKGTQKIGALDWEKEKPLYEEIIRLYDEYAETTDEAKRLELIKKINGVCSYYDTPGLSVSVGIGNYPTDGTSFDELYDRADEALYRAKKFGKSRFEFFNLQDRV